VPDAPHPPMSNQVRLAIANGPAPPHAKLLMQDFFTVARTERQVQIHIQVVA
jgi:hypothetical protein